MLLLTALIWGSSFVAQRAGMEYIGPFTFNVLRSLIGGLTLIPVILIIGRSKSPEAQEAKDASESQTLEKDRKTLLLGGVCCGLALFIACSLQQVGIVYTTAGKAGFITALYIVLVPILGFYWKKSAAHYMVLHCSFCCRPLSPLHERWFFPQQRRLPGASLRIVFFYPHFGH